MGGGKIAETIFTVSEVNRAVKQFLEGTHTFNNIFLIALTFQKETLVRSFFLHFQQ